MKIKSRTYASYVDLPTIPIGTVDGRLRSLHFSRWDYDSMYKNNSIIGFKIKTNGVGLIKIVSGDENTK